MIRTQATIDDMLPADAYQLGWTDAMQAEDDGFERASKAHRDLQTILDRAISIAPWAYAEVYDGDADKA